MPAAERTVEIDVSPDQLMATIVDFEAYPSFLPETREARILHSAAGVWEVRFAVQIIRRLEYTLRLTQPDPLSLDWTLVEGVFTTNEGGWRLSPLDEGRRTRARYRIDARVGMFVPGNIVRSLLETSLPRTLERFKAEAERRAAEAG